MFDWCILTHTRQCRRFVTCLIGLFWLVLDSLIGLSHVRSVYIDSF